MDELELEKAIINGEAVARFLNDPTIKSVLKELELLYFKQWSAAADLAAREALWHRAKALDDIATSLEAVKQAGQIAKLQKAKQE